MTTPNASKRYIVDSSGWIEYLGDGPKAEAFARFFEKEEALLLPTIIVYGLSRSGRYVELGDRTADGGRNHLRDRSCGSSRTHHLRRALFGPARRHDDLVEIELRLFLPSP